VTSYWQISEFLLQDDMHSADYTLTRCPPVRLSYCVHQGPALHQNSSMCDWNSFITGQIWHHSNLLLPDAVIQT